LTHNRGGGGCCSLGLSLSDVVYIKEYTTNRKRYTTLPPFSAGVLNKSGSFLDILDAHSLSLHMFDGLKKEK
jgi:hypothetical protein